MTSTRGNPRIGQSTSALSSLGAVGGPRGTAAGALRVIVEFLTQYDPKAVKQLESDLQGLTQLEEQLGNQQISIADRVSKQRTKIAEAEALQTAKFTDRQAKAALKQSQVLRQTGRPSDTKEAQQLLTFAIKRQGLSAAEEKTVRSLVGARTRLINLEKQALAISSDRLAVDEQEGAVQGQLSAFQNLKANLPSKLGGLALGAVGGLVGGAILGVGFQAAQAGLDAVAEGIKDLIDPARHARDAIHDIGPEIEAIAEAAGGDRMAAAEQFLESLGIHADKNTIAILAQAAAQDKLSKSIDDQIKIEEIKKHADALSQENIKRETDLLIEQAKQAGNLKLINGREIGARDVTKVADAAYYEKQAIAALTGQLEVMDKATADAAAEQKRLQDQLQATAALADIAARALSQAISTGSNSFINPISNKIDALQASDGESARTKSLQAKIDQLQNGGDSQAAAKNKELANIAQERELILLRQRLALLGTNIDLDKYSGKFLLEAINAKIKALDKQSAAQDRLNKELDLQLRASQQLKRNQGESVGDFLERRAKENRDILSEQRSLEDEKIKESLQAQADKVQTEVDLEELSQRKRDALAKSGSDNRIKNLQKELEASKKADAAALKAKIAALEKERDALKTSADNADYYATVSTNEQIRQAIRAANTIEKITQLAGETQGLLAAQSFLKALVSSGALSPAEVKQVQAAISRIGATLDQIGTQEERVYAGALVRPGQAPKPFAKGGYIPLNAGSTPFGNSARFGEHGTEAGMMVMTTAALNKAKQRGGSDDATIGQVNIYRAEDPQRAQYQIKKAVGDAMREALN